MRRLVWLVSVVLLSGAYLPGTSSVAAQELKIIDDPSTRVRVGIPINYAAIQTTQQWGQNWKSSDRRLSIDTLNFGAESLDDRLRKLISKPNREITKKDEGKNRFVLVGRDKGRVGQDSLFYVEMHANAGEIRGLSVVYSAAHAPQLDSVVKKVIASFEPFPKPIIAQLERADDSRIEERDRKIKQLTEVIENRDRQLTELSVRMRILERQPNSSRREEEFRAEREALLRERDSSLKQRDDLRRELDEASNERSSLQARIASLQKKIGELTQAEPQSRRLALVIGNNEYGNLPADRQLQRAVNDARAIGDALNDIGFDVMRGENLNLRDMDDLIKRFTRSISPGDIALIFFSGHGVAIAGANYLLPSDVRSPGPSGEALLRTMAVAEIDLIAELQRKKTRVGILVLDACRDNPFRGSGPTTKAFTGGERGLARNVQAQGQGVFAIYSAGFNQTALDSLGPKDTAKCSVFTRSLVGRLYHSHNTHLADIIIDVREEVSKRAKTVGHEQYPAYYDETQGGRIFLRANLPPSEAHVGGGGGCD